MIARRTLVGAIVLAAAHGGGVSALLVPSQQAEPDVCGKTCLMETAGIKSSLATLPRRSLTEHERAVLDEDGVVLVRSVVTNRKVIKTLEERIWPVANHTDAQIGSPHFMNADQWNAAVRALVEDDLFASLSASAFSSDEVPSYRYMHYDEAPVWGKPGTADGKMRRCAFYHFDTPHPTTNGHACEQITIWLALTDGAKYPLEFVRRSHKVRKELEDRCGSWRVYTGTEENFTTARFDKDCADRLVGSATQQPGPAWSVDMEAGDAFIFTGNTLHMGVDQGTPRLAISLRYTSPQLVGGKRCHDVDRLWHPPGTMLTITKS